MKVLLIKTSSMGDVIHTFPAITDASRAIPQLQLDWVVEEAFTEIPPWHQAVSTVIPVAIRRWRSQPIKTLFSDEWKTFQSDLSANNYDLIIDAQGLIKSAFITRLARGERYGLDRHSAREPLASLAYKHRFSIDRHQHAVERTRQLFANSLGYALPKSVGECELHLSGNTHQQTQSPYVIFIHGTTRANKHWLDDNWIDLARRASSAGLTVKLPWYTAEEKSRAEKIAAACDSVVIIPKSNLNNVAEEISRTRAFVAVDTGLGHLGAALDVPGVSLYGSTDPAKIGAYGSKQIHLHEKTMDAITTEQVWEKLQQQCNHNS